MRHSLPPASLLLSALLWGAVGCSGGYGLEAPQDGGSGGDASTLPDGAIPSDAQQGPDAAPASDAVVQPDAAPASDAVVQPDASGCTPTATQPCTCPGGSPSTATCQPDRSWGACDCPPPCTPVGHDEDGDQVDDACDVCPTWPDPGQADGDGDGLGDACEWPGEPGRLSYVDAFEPWAAGGGLPAGWAETGGFSLGTDALHGANGSGGDNAVWDSPLSVPYGAEMTFVPDPPGWGDNWLALLFGWHDPGTGTPAWYGCFLYRNRGMNSSVALELWHYPGSGQNVLQDETLPAPEPVEARGDAMRRLRVFVRGGVARCLFESEDGDHAEVSHDYGVPPQEMNGVVGYRVYSWGAQFQSIITYQ